MGQKRRAIVQHRRSAEASGFPEELIPASWRRADYRGQFRRRLLRWFARHQRDLPWRRTTDPYAIWVSEIMLQQTQVQTVRPYFERFLAAFPTVGALAQADREQVLRLWEGLGYYRRAVQLHQAAQKIVAELGGRFPQNVEQVRQLPGIGRYTAGAILSIAFDQREPILEANTTRLWARLLGYPHQPTAGAAQRLFWAMAELILPERHVGRFNQALMELGSTVCLPRQPHCPECPVVEFCRAFQEGKQESIPPPRPKPAVEYHHEAALVIRRKEQVLLYPIPEDRRWSGLWDFPRFPLPPELSEPKHAELPPAEVSGSGSLFPEPLRAERQLSDARQLWLFPEQPRLRSPGPGRPDGGTILSLQRRSRKPANPGPRGHPPSSSLERQTAAFLARQIQQWAGIRIESIRFLKTIRYGVTRFRIRMDCYEAEYGGPAEEEAEGSSSRTSAHLRLRWIALKELDRYPLSSPGRKLARIAQNRLDEE